MALLAARLRAANIQPSLFAYVAAFESFAACADRLRRFIAGRVSDADDGEYILIGHSLGTVLIRAVLPQLRIAPRACFFLAPPTRACRAAHTFAPRRWFKLLTGEMGQLLASESFMNALPTPQVPTRIYAGTAGPRGRLAPFGNEPNDGVLAVSETQLASVPSRTVPAVHTFIMNSRAVVEDIVRTVRALPSRASGAGQVG
jgi:hypothetical protein